MFEEIFFYLRSNRTTIDCNLFDIEILFKNFLLVFQTKTKQNKVFLRGGKKRNVRSQKKTLTSLTPVMKQERIVV